MPVVLKKSNIEFPTVLLVDSGADYSMIRRDIAQDIFNIDISSLKKKGDSSGIGGKVPVGIVELTISFGLRQYNFEEKIPFQIPLDPKNEIEIPLLGRNPFFYNYRVDFRMGFTDDPSLGKFVIYPEKHRPAEKYGRPMKIKK